MFKTLYDGIITYYVDIKRYMTGWWYTYPSEKYEFVNWDDYSQYMEKYSKCSLNQQSVWAYQSNVFGVKPLAAVKLAGPLSQLEKTQGGSHHTTWGSLGLLVVLCCLCCFELWDHTSFHGQYGRMSNLT